MPFLEEFRIHITSDVDDEQSDSSFSKPRGRGKAREWTVLHACSTVEEFKANYPNRDEFFSKTKTKTCKGQICYFQCKTNHCNYFLRCFEDKLVIESSGEHLHEEEVQPPRKRGLTKEQRSIVDRCISMGIRGGKSIATEFISYNEEFIKNGQHPVPIPNYRRINHYVDHTVNKENGRTADLTLGKLKVFIENHFPETPEDDKVLCIHQAYHVESLSFQVLTFANN